MTLLTTVSLLVLSNAFMTLAWYGHLRFLSVPLWVAILGSWGIALIEYCFQVPANRLGYHAFSAYELKTIQEIITSPSSSSSRRSISARGLSPSIWQGFFSSFWRPGRFFKTVTGWNGDGKGSTICPGRTALLITIQAPGGLFVL